MQYNYTIINQPFYHPQDRVSIPSNYAARIDLEIRHWDIVAAFLTGDIVMNTPCK